MPPTDGKQKQLPAGMLVARRGWSSPKGSPTETGSPRTRAASRKAQADAKLGGVAMTVQVAVVIALLVGLAVWGLPSYCKGYPASCVQLPTAVSGLYMIPVEDMDEVSNKGSYFDGFIAKYFCTANASQPDHTPTLLFSQPAVLQHSSASKSNEGLDLLIGILSGCQSTALRTAVRATWQRLDSKQWGKWKAVFIVGNCRTELAEEQAEHGDLLFTSPKESYYALTAKVLDFFDYAATVGARFTMKTDDDTFVFIDRLLEQLEGMLPACLYWGSSDNGYLPSWEKVYRKEDPNWKHVLDVPTVKWYIPPHDFRLIENTNYMPGGGYILSRNLVDKVANRRVTVPSHLPEDAVLGALVGREAFESCSCADSRHIKDVDDFQGIKLMSSGDKSPQGGVTMAKECEVSNAIHRALTVHGIRDPSLHHETLRLATLPRMLCPVEDREVGVLSPAAGGLFYAEPKERRHAIWGRVVVSTGHSIYMEAEFYNNMANTVYGWNDRPVAFQTLVAEINEGNYTRGATGFYSAYEIMKRDKRLPSSQQLYPVKELLYLRQFLPGCVRLRWAAKIAKMLEDLNRENLLLCDMHINRLYINSTNMEPVLSAGQAQARYTSTSRYHAGAWCFSDTQCAACFRSEGHGSPMDWLPEASCSRTTNRCYGFDGSSQAVAMMHHLLEPLLLPEDNETFDKFMRKRLMQLLDGDPRGSEPTFDSGIASRLIADLEGLYRGQEACVERHLPILMKTVQRLQKKWNRKHLP